MAKLAAPIDLFCEKWRSFAKKQYFCKCNGMAGIRGTRLLIEGLQPRLHVAKPCQSTMLFGTAATLLAGCFFLCWHSCKSQWNSIGNSSTSTTCNPICIAGTILQLQITMEFCRPHMHEKQVKPHLQCGTDPSMIRP